MRRTPINAVSPRRKRQNKARRKAMIERFGTDPACVRCGARADDAHEIVTRARGGSILDPEGIVPVCRPCHIWITSNPDAAHAEGLMKHSWERDGGDAT